MFETETLEAADRALEAQLSTVQESFEREELRTAALKEEYERNETLVGRASKGVHNAKQRLQEIAEEHLLVGHLVRHKAYLFLWCLQLHNFCCLLLLLVNP